jgi:FAD-dependent oxidoreductase domain-containing protein 1
MMAKTYDVIIIGGGIMGSASAYYLMKMDNTLKVAVIERDLTYAKASTTLSMANARIQFSLEQNIAISQYALKTLEQFEETMAVAGERPKIYYRREGNLFLVDDAGRRGAEKSLALQQSLGCRVDWWPPEKIKRYYPLYETKDVAGGTFGRDDGYFDAYAVLMAYKAKAKSMGAEYINEEVEKVRKQHGRVTGVRTVPGATLTAGWVVNCAGAWAAKVAETAGINLPVVPVKRQVFTLDTAVKPQGPLPLTVLPSGLYFRTETGGVILLGKSMVEDPIGYEFSWDDKRFMEILWPELAAYVPAFDRLKLVRGWAGLYAVNTLDGNAILGEWPEIRGLFLANGFSGHGLQQAPAVGRYLSELILKRSHSLDLSIFSPIRILENRPLGENGLV